MRSFRRGGGREAGVAVVCAQPPAARSAVTWAVARAAALPAARSARVGMSGGCDAWRAGGRVVWFGGPGRGPWWAGSGGGGVGGGAGPGGGGGAGDAGDGECLAGWAGQDDPPFGAGVLGGQAGELAGLEGRDGAQAAQPACFAGQARHGGPRHGEVE